MTDLQTELKTDLIGLQTANLVSASQEWVNRRVESVVFRDDVSVHRRVSVDLSVPDNAPTLTSIGTARHRLLPLTLLDKRPLTNFDLRDEQNAALPALTRGENGIVAANVLRAIGRVATGSPVDDAAAERLEKIAVSARDDAIAALQELEEAGRVSPDGSKLHRLAQSPLMRRWGWRLAENFLLLTPVTAEDGERRIIKYSYEQPFSLERDTRSCRRRVAEEIGWLPTAIQFLVPSVGESQGFHFEVAAPEGVGITEAAIGQPARDQKPARVFSSASGGSAGRSRVHLYASGGAGAVDARATVLLRATRRGWLRSCAGVAWLIAAVMVGGAIRVRSLVPDIDTAMTKSVAAPATSADAAALLLALVGVIATALIRPGEHAVTARLLAWLRPLAVVAALVPYAAAWVLAFGPTGDALVAIWRALAGISIILAILLTRSFSGPRIAR